MTYPVLEAAADFAWVEIRQGSGAAGWNDLEALYSGPCEAGQQWQAGEGEKLAVRHCLWPSDPASTMSQPYTVASTIGLLTGEQEFLRFPGGV